MGFVSDFGTLFINKNWEFGVVNMTFLQQLIFNVVIMGVLSLFVYAITHGKNHKNNRKR